MMKNKSLEQNYILITNCLQLAEKFQFHMKFSNMLCLLFYALHIFLTIMLLKMYFCLFIDRQPHWNPENYPEQNLSSQERSIATKDYRGKQQRYFHPHPKYNEREKYRHGRRAPTSSSYNQYGSESYDYRGYIPSDILPRSTYYVPKLTKYLAK